MFGYVSWSLPIFALFLNLSRVVEGLRFSVSTKQTRLFNPVC